MSDLGNFITLGVGPSGDIPHFILFGLSAGAAVEPLLAEYELTARTELADTVIAGTEFTAEMGAGTLLASELGVRTMFRATQKIAFEDD